MNERIKELSIKAGFPEWSNHAIEFELEQFAELIIRECAEFVRKQNYESIRNEEPYNVASTDILKHFGVEECH